jgi:hypothetical protein
MQPKGVPCHIRIKHAPTIKKPGRSCRLYGKTFDSIAEAARCFGISYSWAVEQVNNGWNMEDFPKKARRKLLERVNNESSSKEQRRDSTSAVSL